MSSTRTVILALILCAIQQLSAAAQASAKTWFVEKDGSGDFAVIQDAVNAAASGDTVRIGLGRFDEKNLVTCPGWSEYVRVLVSQQELTIIGSGSGTIIGQVDPWEPGEGSHKGIATGDLWGNQILRIESLHLENMRAGVYTGYEDSMGNNLFEIRDCSFNGNDVDLWLLSDGGIATVSNCNFQNSTSEGKFILGWNHMNLEIRECVFRRQNHIYSTKGIGLSGSQNSLIENCQFFESSTGVGFSYCGPVLVKNCLFDDQLNTALAANVNANISIEGCQFRNQHIALQSSSGDIHVEMTDSVIEDADYCSFLISRVGSLTAHNCDLAKGERGVVYINEYLSCPFTAHLDMTNNYWGTVEPDSIRAWITDRNDTDEACYWVEYEPFSPGTTPVEKTSLGGFRAMFR